MFSAQKIAAAVHWPLSTPYTVPAPGGNALFALIITAVTVGGGAVLLRATLRSGRGATVAQAAAAIVWLGSLATLVSAATEARFAVPLVLFGIAGCAMLASGPMRLPRARAGAWVAGSLVAVAAVYGVALTGLQHPVDGDASVSTCAAG